ALFRSTDAETFGQIGGHTLESSADIRALKTRAALLGGLDNGANHVRRNREPDPHRASGARIDRSVDTDQASAHVDQRTARISGIDGRIGLYEEIEIGNADLSARLRGNDTARYRLANAEWIANG